tara:strand:+ start:1092 stop:1397 length:306 start_codon:yes stop_codon:yes gene_type:complete
MIRIFIFFIIVFLSITKTQAKVCEIKNVKSILSLKEKIRICDPGDRLYINFDIKIKAEILIVYLCSLKDTVISREETQIIHKRNSGVSLICIYQPDKNFIN